jgi:pyruvate/2-oxoglutarate dehydrogenase complex dihydrolipoamide acyltransferase (E2) component
MITPVIVPRYIALLKKYGSKPTITKWFKNDGQKVEQAELLVVIETSKASLEVESPAAGLVIILKKEQEKVKIGDTIGVIAESADEFSAYAANSGG